LQLYVENLMLRIMLKTFLNLLLLASTAALIGCGTPGDLYIPEQRYPLPPEEAPQTPAVTPDSQPTKE